MLTIYKKETPLVWQKYENAFTPRLTILNSEPNIILPFVSDWYVGSVGLSVPYVYLNKYDLNLISGTESDFEDTKIESALRNLDVQQEIVDGKYRWYYRGDFVLPTLLDGLYNITFIDILDREWKSELFKATGEGLIIYRADTTLITADTTLITADYRL